MPAGRWLYGTATSDAPLRRRPGGRSAQLNPAARAAVQRIVNSGKEKNTALTSYVPNSDITSGGPALQDLTDMAQGDGEDERIGDVVHPVSVRMAMNYYGGASATQGQAMRYRVIVFRWLPDNSVEAPVASKLLESTTLPFGLLTTSDVDRSKFEILFDRCFIVTNDLNGADTGVKFIKWSKKASKKIYFNEGATTGRNHLYYFAISDQSGTNTSEQEGHIAVNYLEG